MIMVAIPTPLFVKKLSREEILREGGITPLPYSKVVAHKRQALQESRLRADPFFGKFGRTFRFLWFAFWALFFGNIVTTVFSGISTIYLLASAALAGTQQWQYALITGATAIISNITKRILFLSMDHDPISLILDIGQLKWDKEPWREYYYRGNSIPEEVRTVVETAEKAGYPVKIESFCYDPFAVVGRWPRKVYIACWNCPGFDPNA